MNGCAPSAAALTSDIETTGNDFVKKITSVKNNPKLPNKIPKSYNSWSIISPA